MARHRSCASAPLLWAAIPGMRSLYEHLLERLAQLPRDAAGVLLRSAAACLRQVAAALLRLLRGPAQAGVPNCKKAHRRPDNPPVRSEAQGGDAVKGACLGGPAQAGAPISKKACGGPGKPPVPPGTQGGDAVTGPCLGGPAQAGTPISRPGTQGGDAVKGACFAAPDSGPGVNKVGVLDGAEAPELAESDAPAAKNSCSEFGEVATTITRTKEGPSHELLQDSSTPDDSTWGWEPVKKRKTGSKKMSKMAPQFPPPQVKCCTYCEKNGHLAMDCPGNKASSSQTSSCTSTRNGCHRKAKHGDKDKYDLDLLFAEDEEDEETKAHRTYQLKVCKKDHILCLACHLNGTEVPVKNKKEKMEGHFAIKHGSDGNFCKKRGCLAMAKTKHDIGLHQYICHRI